MTTPLTEYQLKQIQQWIYNHTYSASSHNTYDQGSCDWLRADELQEYLPNFIASLLNESS